MKYHQTIYNFLILIVIAAVIAFMFGINHYSEKLTNHKTQWSNNFEKQTQFDVHYNLLSQTLKKGRLDEHLLYYSTASEVFHLQEAKAFASDGLESINRILLLDVSDKTRQLLMPIKDALQRLINLQHTDNESIITTLKSLDIYQFTTQEQFRKDLINTRKNEEQYAEEVYQRHLADLNTLTVGFNFAAVAAWFLGILGIAIVIQLRRHDLQSNKLAELTLEKLEVTEAHNAQSRFTAALFAALPVAVITISDKGIIQRCNPATKKILGYDADDLLGENVKKIMPMSVANQHDTYLSDYQKTGVANIIGIGREVTAKAKDGHTIDVHLSVTRYEVEGETEYAGILVDLSEIMKQRNEIADAMIKIEASNKELQVAIEKANIASESKDMFLATASHEIRTPLTGVFGMVDLLNDTDLSPEQAQYIDILKTSGQQLMAIVNDILDTAKLQDNSLELHTAPHPLNEMCDFIKTTFTPLARQKGVHLNVAVSQQLEHQYIWVDNVRLVQVMSNLCSNAVKFTHEGQVDVQVKTLAEDDQSISILFSVRDSGIGIKQTDITQLAQPFTQVDNRLNRSGTGTGLGLTIASSLIHKMGGELKIDSKIGIGSKFSCVLKFDKAEVPEHHKTLEVSSPLNTTLQQITSGTMTPRLLIAEDNPINRMVIEKLLTNINVDFHVVENGQELVNEAQKEAYDLIITDIQMPIMDGLEATRVLRSIPKIQSTPIVALTAAAFEDEKQRIKEAGIDDYVAKPIDRTKLISVIEKYLNQNKST